MYLDIEQNTDDWLLARSGHLTGSVIPKVMANDGKAFGDPAKRLAVEIALEQLHGRPILNSYTNADMERGHEQEPIARMLYEREYFSPVTNGGFFDNGFTGCSPDGLVGADGVVEIKSVIPSVQYKTMMRGSFDPAYKWQLIFNLHETGREWIDYVSFSADYTEAKRLIVHRVTIPDVADDLARMLERVAKFETLVNQIKEDISE